MKLFFNTQLYIAIMMIFALSSCETNEVTRLKFDKAAITMLVGQSDSLTATVSYSGELSQFPHEWKIADPTIFSITEKISNEKSDGASFEKTVVIKALKSGTTTLSINIGGKTLSCDVKVSQRSFNLHQALAENWGDYYETETNNYDMFLLENTLSFDEDGQVQGDGNLLYLEFYVPLTKNTLSAGDFYLSDSGEGEEYTFEPGAMYEFKGEDYFYGSRLINIDGDIITISFIKDGDFSISKNGNNFVVEGDFILGDDEIIHFSYTGAIEDIDQRNPIVIHPILNKGLLVYYDDAYESSTNNFNLYLAAETVVSEDSVRVDELIVLEFNTATTVIDSIPQGSYTMLTKNDEIVPYSLVFGYVNNNDVSWGTWYYGHEMTKKIKKGEMNVRKTGEVYTIDYELYDRFGSEVSGTFEGPLEYFDATAENQNAAPSYIKGNKKKGTSAQKMLRQITNKTIKKKPLRW